jgi:NAD(P)-dependent dehydrogenase (short-subunit alcohol dehydrogenase family)
MAEGTGPEQDGAAAFVTGAGSGIGRATAVRLAADGWTVSLLDRSADGLSRTAELVSGAGRLGETAQCDLADAAALEATVGPLVERLPLELLVNNAGVGFRATAADTTDEQWDLTLAVNLTAMFLVCRLVLPGMVERGRGQIVNVASAGGLVGLRQRVAYCASKAGVIGLTRALAADHAGQGIRVNAIAPGTVDTEWVERMLADDPDRVATRSMMEDRQLDGRLGSPEEVAGGIAFLAGRQGRFFNGSVMVMDAGLTAV